jgi:hypothetical protein
MKWHGLYQKGKWVEILYSRRRALRRTSVFDHVREMRPTMSGLNGIGRF